MKQLCLAAPGVPSLCPLDRLSRVYETVLSASFRIRDGPYPVAIPSRPARLPSVIAEKPHKDPLAVVPPAKASDWCVVTHGTSYRDARRGPAGEHRDVAFSTGVLRIHRGEACVELHRPRAVSRDKTAGRINLSGQ